MNKKYLMAGYRAKKLRERIEKINRETRIVEQDFLELREWCRQEDVDLHKILKDHKLSLAFTQSMHNHTGVFR